MSDKLNLKQKLVEIRKTIGILQKTEKGNQGASYVDPAVILLKIREAMDKHNVLLSCSILSHTITKYTAPTKNNPNNIGFMTEGPMVYTWLDADSDESIECNWYATGSHISDPSMSLGGGLTYSERYFLLKFFQVPTTKDDPEFLKGKAGVIELINKDQVANIEALIEETKTDIPKFLNHFCIKKIDDIYASNYNNVINLLEAKR